MTPTTRHYTTYTRWHKALGFVTSTQRVARCRTWREAGPSCMRAAARDAMPAAVKGSAAAAAGIKAGVKRKAEEPDATQPAFQEAECVEVRASASTEACARAPAAAARLTQPESLTCLAVCVAMQFRRELLAWYDQQHRVLPWRRTPHSAKPAEQVREGRLARTMRGLVTHLAKWMVGSASREPSGGARSLTAARPPPAAARRQACRQAIE